jgi:hypothetical protein
MDGFWDGSTGVIPYILREGMRDMNRLLASDLWRCQRFEAMLINC